MKKINEEITLPPNFQHRFRTPKDSTESKSFKYKKKKKPTMIVLIVFIAMCIALLVSSFWASKKIKAFEDFTIAGRGLGPLLVTFTIASTWMGGATTVGYPGSAFAVGVSIIWWFIIGAVIGMILFGLLLAGRIRRLAQMTVSDIFDMRYGTPGVAISSFIYTLMAIVITAVQIRAAGTVLAVVLGFPMEVGMIVATLVILVYTILGGMWGLAITDFIYGMVLWPGVIAVGVTAFVAAGGAPGLATLPSAHFSLVGYIPLLTGIGFLFSTLFLVMGDAAQIQKVCSAKSERVAKISVILALILMLIIYVSVTIAGMSARILFPGISPPDLVMPTLIKDLLPLPLAALTLAALMAAVMSSADSFLVVGSSFVSKNIYKRLVNPKIAERRIILMTKIVVLILGLMALLIAWYVPGIIPLIIHAYMIGSIMLISLLAALFWRRATTPGAILSMVLGIIVYFTWIVLGKPFGIHEVVIGIVVTSIMLIFVSFFTPPQEERFLKPFFG